MLAECSPVDLLCPHPVLAEPCEEKDIRYLFRDLNLVMCERSIQESELGKYGIIS